MTDPDLRPGDVADRIRVLLARDDAAARARSNDDTLAEARVSIVGKLLEQCERWRDNAESWDWQEQYCNNRARVYEQLLQAAETHLWDEESPV